MTDTDRSAEQPHADGRARRQLERWHAGSFGPASEEPYRRRTTDWIRLFIAVVVVTLLIAHQGELTTAERDVFSFFNNLPDGLRSMFSLLYRAGALWALLIVIAAALVARRWRLARDLALAGVVAWILARLIGALVVGEESLAKALDVVTRLGDDSPAFPLVRLAVIVAVLAAASPYLTRPVRLLGWTLAFLMALAAMYLGTGLPDGILTVWFLGWGVGALIHVTFGSPGGRPTSAQVGFALAELGVPAEDVQLAPDQTTGATTMLARDDEGPLTVRVLGRDEADAQILSMMWRGALYKDGGPTVHLTRLEDVEHEAYTILLAERSGVKTPTVVVAGVAGPGAALIVTRPPAGVRLADVDPESVTDEVLDALWPQVAALAKARVAHGRLNARHIVLSPDGPVLVDFGNVAGAATPAKHGADVAELLYSTAMIVGDDRAVAAALRGVGPDALAAALPILQPAALSGEMRSWKRQDKKDLKEHLTALRTATAAAAGVEEPALQELYRVNSQSLLMAVGTLIAVFALLSQVGDPQTFWDTIKNADWAWLAVALFISFLTNFATAISLMGCVPMPLPMVRTAELQLSMSFSNLAVPAVGGMAAQVRFLQKQGIDLASAVAAGGLLSTVGNIAAQVLLLIVAVLLAPTQIDLGKIDTDSVVQVLILLAAAIVVALAVILGVKKIRDKVLPPVKSAITTIREALRSPKRVFLLFFGSILNAIMYAFVLDVCLVAFGGHINYWTLLTLNIFVGTIASLVPIPGGGTAVSSVGMTGALTAAGIPSEIAVAAVLANQLVASFIPAVPGWFATKNLLKDDYL